jgi:hypothetical protein
MWNQKRTDRVELPRQLRLDPEMGKRIRTRAELNRRTIQQELLHLLESGLKAEKVRFRRLPSKFPLLSAAGKRASLAHTPPKGTDARSPQLTHRFK